MPTWGRATNGRLEWGNSRGRGCFLASWGRGLEGPLSWRFQSCSLLKFPLPRRLWLVSSWQNKQETTNNQPNKQTNQPAQSLYSLTYFQFAPACGWHVTSQFSSLATVSACCHAFLLLCPAKRSPGRPTHQNAKSKIYCEHNTSRQGPHQDSWCSSCKRRYLTLLEDFI